VREPDAAHDSRHLAFLQTHEPRSTIAIAHVRRATQGPRMLRNTQPFSRELGGRMHLFAHNGMLQGIEGDPRFQPRSFRRIGDTDSEYAFCDLLGRLREPWERGAPSLDDRLAVIETFAAELRSLGPANFIYTDGELIFAHGHQRRTDAGAIEPPGLHVLCRRCASRRGRADQEVALVASVPHGEAAPLADGGSSLAGGGSSGGSGRPVSARVHEVRDVQPDASRRANP
jgi:glutamine amidotransferase